MKMWWFYIKVEMLYFAFTFKTSREIQFDHVNIQPWFCSWSQTLLKLYTGNFRAIYCMLLSSRYLEDDGWNKLLKQETIFCSAKHVNFVLGERCLGQGRCRLRCEGTRARSILWDSAGMAFISCAWLNVGQSFDLKQIWQVKRFRITIKLTSSKI